MARVSRVPDAEDLNLTPIMNMVLVLIPLMLLNVVFMSIMVIEVTMPQRSAGAATNSDPPKRLQLFISQQGFTVVKSGMPLQPVEGCTSGPTICAKEGDFTVETDRHDWLSLYNALFEIKQDSEWQSHDTIEIVADSSVNFGVLVKAMDIARNQRVVDDKAAKDATVGMRMQSLEELNKSVVPQVQNSEDPTKKEWLGMFPVVVLGLPTVSQ